MIVRQVMRRAASVTGRSPRVAAGRASEGQLRAVVVAYAVSSYGTFLNLIALSLFVYAVSGSGLGLGLLMALRLFAGLLAGLGAGALAALIGRRRMMITADLCQAAAMAALVVQGRSVPVWLLAVVVSVLGAGNTFYNVALRSAIPVLVGAEARVRANGRLVTARSLATVAGFASAAPVVGVAGHEAAFAVNGASFLVSAAVMLRLRVRTEEPGEVPETKARQVEVPEAKAPEAKAPEAKVPESEASGAGTTAAGTQVPGTEVPGTSMRGVAPETKAPESRASESKVSGPGASTLRRVLTTVPALLLGMVVLRGVDALASSSHNVALPLVAELRTPSNPALFMTQFWASWAAGTFLAHQILKRRQAAVAEGHGGTLAFAVGTCAMSICFVLAFTGPAPLLLAVVAGLAGVADGITEIVYTSRLQAAPDRERSRLFGLSATAETCGFTLGTIGAAAALDAWPALAVVALFHGLACCGALFLLLTTYRARRRAHRPQAPARRTTAR
ncbi:MFS transporter [Streptomyces sp. NPDC126499]|uniref:MFS transporter n=1 Tax=Streptomyces sp. NPDC126499 TaxID=3155314 RepID=UPI003333BB2E